MEMKVYWYVILLLIPEVRSQTITERLDQINNYVSRINRKLRTLENTNNKCDQIVANLTSIEHVLSDSTDQCTGPYSHYDRNLSKIWEKMDRIVKPDVVIDLDNTETPDRVCLDVPASVQECFRSFHGEPIDITAAQIVCLQELLWEFTPADPNARSDHERIRDLVNIHNLKTPPTGRRVRHEYRTLTFEKRTRFHNALNRLHKEGMIAVFGRVHKEASVNSHRGPAFLPWHRAFLALFEEALRQVDPSVSLPYWDSSIDFDMDNPVNSVIWTEEYFGNGGGEVTSGPFSQWVTSTGRLERSFGQRSRLISKEDVDITLSKCYFANISRPTAGNDALERFHDGVHTWIGGDMAYVSSAAYDPVFYMHHCFVDYIWERFMERQREVCNVDPTTDYLNIDIPETQQLNYTMTGMDFFNISDGLASWWTQGSGRWYTYASTPMCPFCGGAASLVCDVGIDKCVPESRIKQVVDLIMQPPPPLPETTVAISPMSSEATAAFSSALRPEFDQEPPKLQMDIIESPPLIPAIIVNDIVMEKELVPKNRGLEFDVRESDGRTLLTSFADALRAADGKRRR